MATTSQTAASKGGAAIPEHNGNLLPVLQRAIPSIASYQPLGRVEQANAFGVRVSVHYDETSLNSGNDTADSCATSSSALLPNELFVKQVDASHYAHKSWADLRRTLLYSRTEARFYAEVLPRLRASGRLTTSHLAPECHLAECLLDGLVGEDETATDVSHVAPGASPAALDEQVSPDLLKGKGGALVLTSLGGEQYFQKSPLSPHQAAKCLAAVARLHAAAWEDGELLRLIAERLSDKGGSYHLLIRNPKELKNMVASWQHFSTQFRDYDRKLFDRENIKNLGQRIYDYAEYVSQELSPKFNEEYATCVHGDYKAMNVFLPTDDSISEDAIMIDYASAGIGLGMSDVAMHITHALSPEDLANGGEEELVDGYLAALDTERRRVVKPGQEQRSYAPYPHDVAMRHYQLATVDYFRFILGRFWRSATPESFDKKKDSPNTTLVNRNVGAALAFVARVDKYLTAFEEERKS